MDASEVLRRYSQFSPKVSPAALLTGDIDKREGSITLSGKTEDDLNGRVRRRLFADINAYFYENPLDVDDTRLVFEANEAGAEYTEKNGRAKLVIRIFVELAQYRPEGCCCC